MAAVMRGLRGAMLLLGCLGAPLLAQGSPTLAPSDPAYEDVQRLFDAGLARDVAVGQRPWSRRTFALVASQACLPQGEPPGQFVDAALQRACTRLAERFADDIAALDPSRQGPVVAPLAELRVEALSTDAPARALATNGLGDIEADTRPLTDMREGRRLATGANAAIETASWARVGSRLTLEARPRLWLARPREGDADATLTLRTASARLVAGNAAITLGRELTNWSTAPGGGLFFSANAPPMDMIRVASEQSFRLPWLLRLLGPTSATLQLADVGASVSHSHSRLLAYKVSVEPTPTVQLGASFANHFGGAGARNPSLGRRIVDLLPFIDVFQHHSDSTDFDSDKRLGVDGLVRLPALANAALFGEFAIEDFDVHRLRSVLTEDAAWIAGVRLPSVWTPALGAQLSYHATGIRFYEHAILRNGHGASRFVIGDPLGRDASGWYASMNWEHASGLGLRLDGAYESRGNTEYVGEYTQPGLQGFAFRVVAAHPPEVRRRLAGDLSFRPADGRSMVTLRAGAERVSGPPSPQPEGRTHGLLEARLSLLH